MYDTSSDEDNKIIFNLNPVAMFNNAPILGASSNDETVKEEQIQLYPAKVLLSYIPD
jgi:hypothetical protein